MAQNRGKLSIDTNSKRTIEKGKDLHSDAMDEKMFLSAQNTEQKEIERIIKNQTPTEMELYESKHLQITSKVVSGWLRRTAQKDKPTIKKLNSNQQFPLYFFILKRVRGTMYIFDKPGGNLLVRLDQTELLYVKLIKSENDEMSVPGQVKTLEKQPLDFKYKFEIVTQEMRLKVWAHTETERAHWVSQIQQITVVRSNQDRNDFQSFNGDQEREEEQKQRQHQRTSSLQMINRASLIKYTDEYIEYLIDYYHAYLSASCHSSVIKTLACIQKMSSNTMANQTGIKLFLYRTFEINFQEERVYINKQKKDGEIDDGSTTPRPTITTSSAQLKNANTFFFDQIVSVRSKDLCLESFQSKPIFKFQIHLITTEREYALFARTKKERGVIIREIQRAIDATSVRHNNLKKGAVSKEHTKNGQFESNTSTVSKKEQILAFEHRKMPKKIIQTKFSDGFQGYRSPTMYVSHIQVNGQVKKQIDKVKFYHKEQYHQRVFMLDFSQASLFIFKGEQATTPQKIIELRCIMDVRKYDPRNEQEAPALQQSRFSLNNLFQRHPSQAALAKQSCNWMFGMKLQTNERIYTLYVPTNDDLNQWIRVFALIVEMNKLNLSFKLKNPFTFELEKKHQQEQELQKKQDEVEQSTVRKLASNASQNSRRHSNSNSNYRSKKTQQYNSLLNSNQSISSLKQEELKQRQPIQDSQIIQSAGNTTTNNTFNINGCSVGTLVVQIHNNSGHNSSKNSTKMDLIQPENSQAEEQVDFGPSPQSKITNNKLDVSPIPEPSNKWKKVMIQQTKSQLQLEQKEIEAKVKQIQEQMAKRAAEAPVSKTRPDSALAVEMPKLQKKNNILSQSNLDRRTLNNERTQSGNQNFRSEIQKQRMTQPESNSSLAGMTPLKLHTSPGLSSVPKISVLDQFSISKKESVESGYDSLKRMTEDSLSQNKSEAYEVTQVEKLSDNFPSPKQLLPIQKADVFKSFGSNKSFERRESRNTFRERQFIASNFQVSQPNQVREANLDDVSIVNPSTFLEQKPQLNSSRGMVASSSVRSLSQNGRKFKVRECSIEADGSVSQRSGRIIGRGQVVKSYKNLPTAQPLLQSISTVSKLTQAQITPKDQKLGRQTSVKIIRTGNLSSKPKKEIIVEDEANILTSRQRDELRNKFAKLRAKSYFMKNSVEASAPLTSRKQTSSNLNHNISTPAFINAGGWSHRQNIEQVAQSLSAAPNNDVRKQMLQSAFYGDNQEDDLKPIVIKKKTQAESLLKNLSKKSNAKARNQVKHNTYIDRQHKNINNFSFEQSFQESEDQNNAYGQPDTSDGKKLFNKPKQAQNHKSKGIKLALEKKRQVDSWTPLLSPQKQTSKKNTAQFGEEMNQIANENNESFEDVWD